MSFKFGKTKGWKWPLYGKVWKIVQPNLEGFQRGTLGVRGRFTRQAQIGDVFHVAEGLTHHFEEEIEDLDLLEDEEEFEVSENEISDNSEDSDSSISDDERKEGGISDMEMNTSDSEQESETESATPILNPLTEDQKKQQTTLFRFYILFIGERFYMFNDSLLLNFETCFDVDVMLAALHQKS